MSFCKSNDKTCDYFFLGGCSYDSFCLEKADIKVLTYEQLEQQNAKLISSLRKIAGVKLGGHIDDSVMASHMILEAQQTLAEVRG